MGGTWTIPHRSAATSSIKILVVYKNAVPPPAADFVTELLSRYASRRLASSSVQPPYVQQRRSCGAPPLRNRTASWLDARSACLTPKPSVSPSPRRGFLLYPNVSFSGRAAPAARHSFRLCTAPRSSRVPCVALVAFTTEINGMTSVQQTMWAFLFLKKRPRMLAADVRRKVVNA